MGEARTIVCSIPANTAAGSIYHVNMPCANGTVVKGDANRGVITVAFSK